MIFSTAFLVAIFGSIFLVGSARMLGLYVFAGYLLLFVPLWVAAYIILLVSVKKWMKNNIARFR